MYKRFFKRFTDLIIASAGFVILLPVFIPATLFLAVANGGKPFFTQLRPGRNGQIFRIVKLRTMNDKKDKYGNLLSDAERLTKAGKFVRKISLDEIPQLLNVIKGNMSLVGPRPLLVEYLLLYNEEQARRHEVRPGITGWAQVNGRNDISWRQKFEYDAWYVGYISVSLDIRIPWMTILKAFRSGGTGSGTSVTMEKFTGNE